jgi:hypothetical protein
LAQVVLEYQVHLATMETILFFQLSHQLLAVVVKVVAELVVKLADLVVAVEELILTQQVA